MNCPKCGTAAPDNAKQCPVCGSALASSDADETFVGDVTSRAVTAESAADAETAVGFTSLPVPKVGADVLTPPPSSASSEAPTEIGTTSSVDFGPRYRVERLLGQGGMGSVYLAYDQVIGRKVALKLVRPELMVYPGAMDRFRQELLLASKVSHRNILRIHDLGDAGGMQFISMAYVDGEDLHQLLVREGKLPLDRMLNIARQLCAALDAAHSEGVAHRDLKPQNIMLDKDDHVFVTDFGLAKSLGAADGMTHSGEMLGTPRYMAPEQVEAKHVDARTDIYALGLIFYEMLTGDVPFTAESTLQLMYKRAHEIPPPPKTIVPDIPDWLNNIVMKCLECDPANRYQSAKAVLDDIDAQRKPDAPPVTAPGIAAVSAQLAQSAGPSKSRRYIWIAAAAVVAIGLAVGGWIYFKRPARTLTDKDTIVIADFNNKTGDPVFDDTLKQALAVGLGQSPFLNVLSDGKVRVALGQMNRPAGEKLSEDVAREVCQRTASKAVISGSISSLGNEYVIGLNASNCATGDALAREQVQASGKEKVLDALGSAATKLREQLGESLPSVQKFDVPLDQATTSSLEALKAFTLGRKQSFAAAIPYYERAIELDPNFAAAYARMGTAYRNVGQPIKAKEYITKAFELRDHATERDKLYIASSYYLSVTGELEKAIQTYKLWIQSYPQDWLPYLNLGVAYETVGQNEKAGEAVRESLKLYPENTAAYQNLEVIYLALDRYSEVRSIADQAFARKLDDEGLHILLYNLAFVQGDSVAMAQQVAWFVGKPEVENDLPDLESDSEAYYGRLDKARELTQRAVAFAETAKNKEGAASSSAGAALREALFGNYPAARERANAALSLAPGSRDAESGAALALALAGDDSHAKALADDLGKRFPLDTVMQSMRLPTIRAQLEINRKAPSSAVEILQLAAPYDLSLSAFSMFPVYIRGQAYLAGGQGAEAAAEFQKILDHRGIVENGPTGALAHLGLARAYAIQKDTAKARAAYQDFLTLWKDADPDIPILQQAKAELAALK
jgi:eukaryotic-like serine/threonine-protein kinase